MMSSTNEEDPFLQVQADVISQLNQVRPLFASFLRIRSLSASATNPELLSAHTELTSALHLLNDDLNDLTESISAIQADPYKYGLEIEEVSRRSRFITQLANELEDMRDELAKDYHAAKGQAGGTGNPQRKSSGRVNAELPSPGAFATGNDSFYEERGLSHPDDHAQYEQQQQIRMMQEQEQELDQVFHTVGNLRAQADTMGRELEEQAEMLEVVDGLADRVAGRLETGIKKMGWVIKKNEETASSCCIGILILVLVILLVLVIIL